MSSLKSVAPTALIRRASCASSRLTVFILGWLLVSLAAADITQGQNLSWVKEAMERSKHAAKESLPLWQYDPKVAAGSGDASLHAVTSVNADRLWAVGDRGLVLASHNGGRTWTQQPQLTTLNLYAVTFIDERHGFIVGGTIQPLARASIGIVLTTEDGGQSWKALSNNSLPRLTGMSASRGVLTAWGDYSPLHSSAIIESHDNGQTWRGVASTLGHLQTVARQSTGLQLGVDRAGRLAQLPSRADQALSQLASPTAPLSMLVHTGAQWIAVGASGTMAASRDGMSWHDCTLPFSEAARSACNLRCVASIDRHVWAAGDPGSILLHSEDYGDTWKLQPSDQSWPINAIHFFDQHRGWAVTDAGSIVATRDGGKTWFPQREPIKRLGLQAFAALSTDISWPVLVDSAWQAKQATALNVLHRENTEDAVDFAPDGPSTLAVIASQAALVSASESSKRPMVDRRVRGLAHLRNVYQSARSNTTGHVPDGAKRESDTNRTSAMMADLVMRLRAGKPTVVLIDDMHSTVSSFLTEAVVRAVEEAGSPSSDFQSLEHELFLPPWQVSKVFASSKQNQADLMISVDQMLGDTGLSVIDALTPVHGFNDLRAQNAALRCLQLGSNSLAARNSLFHPTERQPETTRPVDLVKVGNFQLVMGRVHREKAWHALAPNALATDEDVSIWLKKLELIIDQTPRHEVGPALVQLAHKNFAAGRWQHWYATLERAVADAAHSDTSRWSALEEIKTGASDERLAWELSIRAQHTERSTVGGIAQASASKPIASLSKPLELTPFDSDAQLRGVRIDAPDSSLSQVVTASAEETATSASVFDSERVVKLSALKRAVRDFAELSQADGSLAMRADMQLAHFAHRRALAECGGEPKPDALAAQVIAAGPPLAGWQQVAQQELVLASGQRTLTSWTARARSTAIPPRLDGIASEPMWQESLPIQLTSPFSVASELTASTAQFAYDDDYLYMLLRCPHPAHADRQEQATAIRQHDMLREGTDHLHLVLDTDRDYTSACELGVNAAGQTFDRCCGAKEWNPRWYLAIDNNQAAWTAELAIKLADLTTTTDVAGRAWAISGFRYIPAVDLQSWSQLRSYNPRYQGNGLLLFEP